MPLNVRQLIEEDLVGHPSNSDPVFDCVAFAHELESQGYEDGLALTNSVQSVDWDYFPVIYKQYRENVNKYKRDQYLLEHGFPKKLKIKLKVCHQCLSYFYKAGYSFARLFCSRECWRKSLIKTKPIIICEMCKKEFTHKNKKTKCCSRACAAEKAKKTMRGKHAKKVVQICKSTNAVLETHESFVSASKKTGIGIGNINRACKRNGSAGGYIWRYGVNEDATR